MPRFNRSIGGGYGSQPTTMTGQGLSSERGGSGSAITGPTLATGYSQAQGAPDPNAGTTSPGGTAARFPALGGNS